MINKGDSVAGAIAVETDLFEHRNVKPHFINPCCFGEDFAGWLISKLTPLSNSGFTFSEPIQEDYGWGFWASHGAERFWIAISYVGDGPQEPPAQWIISADYDPGFNPINRLFHKVDQQTLSRLRKKILDALASDSAIKRIPNPE